RRLEVPAAVAQRQEPAGAVWPGGAGSGRGEGLNARMRERAVEGVFEPRHDLQLQSETRQGNQSKQPIKRTDVILRSLQHGFQEHEYWRTDHQPRSEADCIDGSLRFDSVAEPFPIFSPFPGLPLRRRLEHELASLHLRTVKNIKLPL